MHPEDATNPPARQEPLVPHVEPLRWIGAYKLLKAALALVGGLMVLRIEHRDLPLVALRWMNRLHIDPHSQFGHYVLRHVLEIKPSRLTWAATLLFVYTVVGVAEGLGLIFRKTWAEWLTVITTSALIPYEVYRLAYHTHWLHAVIVVLNVLVVWYLVWRIRRDRRRRQARGFDVAGPAVPPTR
jgi:uncharacterized membrane protein (DUF2068 family)